jgi:hypothetical protein
MDKKFAIFVSICTTITLLLIALFLYKGPFATAVRHARTRVHTERYLALQKTIPRQDLARLPTDPTTVSAQTTSNSSPIIFYPSSLPDIPEASLWDRILAQDFVIRALVDPLYAPSPLTSYLFAHPTTAKLGEKIELHLFVADKDQHPLPGQIIKIFAHEYPAATEYAITDADGHAKIYASVHTPESITFEFQVGNVLFPQKALVAISP